jgi:hypothetical protein
MQINPTARTNRLSHVRMGSPELIKLIWAALAQTAGSAEPLQLQRA